MSDGFFDRLPLTDEQRWGIMQAVKASYVYEQHSKRDTHALWFLVCTLADYFDDDAAGENFADHFVEFERTYLTARQG